jgi:2-polyprenyl-3-methyl-5-hydroxy-6-metoxy-1,4-benzoquinol methylase
MENSFLQPDWENIGLSRYRFESLKPFFLDKTVLDVGCAGGYGRPNWFHESISKVARELVGIDINQTVISSATSQGFNVKYGDAQSFSLNRKFDVVHAGELIEHLDNFHGFLQSAKEHLASNGILLLTTPNATRINNVIYSIFGGLRVNPEHTCWFCEKTITTLLERNGLDIVSIDYIRHPQKSFFRRIISKVVRLFLPDRVAWNNLRVIAKAKDGNE